MEFEVSPWDAISIFILVIVTLIITPPRSWLALLDLKTTMGTECGDSLPVFLFACISQHQLYLQVFLILSPNKLRSKHLIPVHITVQLIRAPATVSCLEDAFILLPDTCPQG